LEKVAVDNLFLELASECRLSMLHELEGRNLKTQEIANLENISATEAVRQLQRLTEALLIQRRPDGSYAITEYGKTMIQLSKPFEFVFKYQEYFSKHDLLKIPPQFVSRIGELSKTKLLMDTMESMDRGQRILYEAQEFAWGIGEGHIPELMVPIMTEQLRKGLELKFILPDTLLPKDQSARNVEMRGLAFLPAVIVLTEKEAGACFRLAGGRIDYAGFYGNDEAFRGWVKDLFLYYWNKGSRIPVPRNG
jgi:predicted transcriptional regulator